jgi:hypothetical protein
MAEYSEPTNSAPIVVAGGAVDSTHPDFDEVRPDWDLMRDCLEGERKIKERGEVYLPKPSGFNQRDDGGKEEYRAYKCRAKFPTIVSPILRGMAGILNSVEPEIDLPPALEGITEKATITGDSIEIVYRRIVRELLTTGRATLLVDLPPLGEAEPGALPFLCLYEAERLINWSKDKKFFVIDETRLERTGFSWWPRRQYRVLEINEAGQYQVTLHDLSQSGSSITDPTFPNMRGGDRLPEIPLVVMGAMDLNTEVGEVPLLGVSQAALAEYRLDADYRHQLYISGQETFVVTGIEKNEAPTILGASVILTFKEGAEASYVD